MADVFIACTTPDELFAVQLGERLENEGYRLTLFVDKGPVTEIPSGILVNLNRADAFILVLSRFANMSPSLTGLLENARKVVEYRLNYGFIIPMIQAGVAQPSGTFDIQPFYFSEYNASSVDMDALKRRLDAAIGRTEEEVVISQSKGEEPGQNIGIGSNNGMVRKIQQLLRGAGYKIVVDGIFGQQTAQIIREFQAAVNLPVTGEVDSMTWTQLNFKQKRNSDSQFWLLGFNLTNWGRDNILEGAAGHYNSYVSSGRKRIDYELFENVLPGDRIVGYDFNSQKKAMCVFNVTNGLYNNSSLGEVIDFEVERVFTSPVDLSGVEELKSFLDQLGTASSARLLRISTELYTDITAKGAQQADIPRSALHSAAARLHSDDSEPEDQLQYEMYAEAIASIIRESKISPPPLNIAIIAPWGQGKTTLMRYIKKRFPQPVPPEDASKHLRFGTLWQLFGASSRLVKWFKRVFYKPDNATVLEELRNGFWKPQPLKHPTVWFNPWRYQSSEQIWAGLGHAIITQLVAKLDPVQREQFWLSLRLKRIDGNAIRKDIHRRMFESVLPWMIAGLLTMAVVIVLVAFMGAEWWWSAVSLGPIIAAAFANIHRFFSKNLEGKFATYVREPNYEEKLGLYHEINEDLSKVCSELISKEHPAIIFIDDLDRCSPKVVTEVIEAINLMMTSDFRDRCYFVFGMDAQMVSAALDAQYSGLAGKFTDKEKIHGSVGWYFLDKFIQLPFFIPVLNSADKQIFLQKFFFEKTAPVKVIVETFKAEEVTADANVALKNTGQLETVKKKYEGREEVLQSAMTRELMSQSKDSPDIMNEVINYAAYLDGSPRGLKRFANLLRFYHTQQKMRVYFPTSSASGSTATTKSLAKWLVINLRWPQMVRWVQWEYEELLLHSAEPEVKAKHIDGMIAEVTSNLPKDGDPYVAWLEFLGEKDAEGKKRGLHLKWLRDRDLFLLLYNNNHEDATLEKALQYDVW